MRVEEMMMSYQRVQERIKAHEARRRQTMQFDEEREKSNLPEDSEQVSAELRIPCYIKKQENVIRK